MAAPTNLRYSDGEISWDAVADADYYELTVNGQVIRSETNSYPYAGNKQDIQISVTACSNQAGAYVSAPLANTCKYLEPVTGFGFDEAGSLIWDAVEGATRYEVVVNGTASETVTTNAYSNIQLDTYYTVAITPRGDFSYTDEPIPYSFEKLSPVTNVQFKDGMITWDAHARASSYEVKINGVSYVAPSNSYNVGNVQETIVIEVYALGGQENSRSFMATAATYTYVPKVTNIRVEEGMLKWDASEGAASYTVKIVNQDRDVNVTETVMNDIVPNTQYVVQSYPNGVEANSYSYWSAEFSSPNTMAGDVLTFTQSVAALNAPRYVENGDINNLEAGTFTLIQNGYDVTVYANAGVSSALSVTYKFYIDGSPEETISSQWTVNLGQNISGWAHTIQAAFLVSGFSDGTYYVSSLDSMEVTVREP